MWRSKPGLLAILLVLLAGLHIGLAAAQPSEPFFNNDETRHVMTGIFFRDALVDMPTGNPKDYAVRYYLQYPALGLLTWPPLFHAIEGAWMLVFGPCFLAAKVLIGIFSAVAVAYFFLLVHRSYGPAMSFIAALLFGVAPLILTYSRHVMLEMPTLAFALAAVFYFVSYLDEGKRRHLWLAAAASSCAALTRFDAVYLLPLFAMLILARRRWDLLARVEVWAAVVAALVVTLPYHVFALREVGWVHLKEDSASDGFLRLSNLSYYVSVLPEQVGWGILIAAAVGALCCLEGGENGRSWPFLAMILATFVTLAPYAEQELRHTIYAVPGLAFLAALGIHRAASWIGNAWIGPVLTTGVLAATLTPLMHQPPLYVRGYEEAARYVLAETRSSSCSSSCCLFDSFLNGNFIYQVRHADPERRLWVLRGDKLFYSTLSDPRHAYQEHVAGAQGILDIIHRYDPELIVVEEPQVHVPLPMSEQLRQVLRNHPERFLLEKEIPLESNYRMFQGVRLLVYRNLQRNERPAERLEVQMQALRRNLQADMER